MEINGERVRLRPVTPDDFERVVDILQSPTVAQWWPNATLERFAKDLFDDDVHGFVIEVDGELIGFIQYCEEPDPEYRHAGIDIAIGERFQGGGLGTDAVRTLARYLTRDLGHHRVTIDPEVANERAVRCYEKVGFKPVGVMRRYTQRADGTWHDGLLMDVLADELE
jgi:aminoglycoside 6'-N-acetyltransferase